MWDRLLTDCHVLTMVATPGNPFGLVTNAAIGIHEGRIVRVGRRTELAGTRASEVVPLGGAFVTPGLIDCHTHLVFGGTRAAEHAQRRAGASYEEIAKAGGGIASTVAATKAASADELRDSARHRLNALMQGGVTTIEIKSGYGLDTASEIRLLNAARAIGHQLQAALGGERFEVLDHPARAGEAVGGLDFRNAGRHAFALAEAFDEGQDAGLPFGECVHGINIYTFRDPLQPGPWCERMSHGPRRRAFDESAMLPLLPPGIPGATIGTAGAG